MASCFEAAHAVAGDRVILRLAVKGNPAFDSPTTVRLRVETLRNLTLLGDGHWNVTVQPGEVTTSTWLLRADAPGLARILFEERMEGAHPGTWGSGADLDVAGHDS